MATLVTVTSGIDSTVVVVVVIKITVTTEPMVTVFSAPYSKEVV